MGFFNRIKELASENPKTAAVVGAVGLVTMPWTTVIVAGASALSNDSKEKDSESKDSSTK